MLLMHRWKNGNEYYAIPGGGVEDGETLEEATLREIKEETNFDAKLNKKILEKFVDYDGKIHHFYLITDFTGELKLGGPEAEFNCDANKYILEWHKLDELKNLTIVPQSLKYDILGKLKEEGIK